MLDKLSPSTGGLGGIFLPLPRIRFRGGIGRGRLPPPGGVGKRPTPGLRGGRGGGVKGLWPKSAGTGKFISSRLGAIFGPMCGPPAPGMRPSSLPGPLNGPLIGRFFLLFRFRPSSIPRGTSLPMLRGMLFRPPRGELFRSPLAHGSLGLSRQPS